MTALATNPARRAPEPTRPELGLLLCIARAKLSPADKATLATLLPTGLDWNYVLQAAARHGLWPLLHHHLEQNAAGPVPDTILTHLREEIGTYRAHALARVDDLHQVLAWCREAGADLIPYKGPVLAQRLYGDYALRQFSDLDFLVRREDVRRANACLLAHGFQPVLAAPAGWEPWFENARHEYSFHHPTSGLYVELHWAAFPRFVAMSVDIRPFWERLETVQLAGRAVPSLKLEELLFVLCLHGTKHQWVRLAWLADIAELIRATPDLDWARVLALAAASRSERFLLIGLRLAQRLLGTPLPGAVTARFGADKKVERLADAIAVNLCDGSLYAPSEVEHLRFLFRALPRQRDRLRFLWGVAVEPCRDDWTFCRLPPALAGLYALIRPCRLLTIGVKHLRGELAPASNPAHNPPP